MSPNRRELLKAAAASGAAASLAGLGLTGCATSSVPASTRVLVVGGGFGGATAAKYVRWLSDYKIDVVLVEPGDAFVSCPISNLVLGGSKTIADVTVPYAGLART
ncbi:MAG: twin-arginine translocation signal domain-containing protein, partial [Burkholderiaceae bacterium]